MNPRYKNANKKEINTILTGNRKATTKQASKKVSDASAYLQKSYDNLTTLKADKKATAKNYTDYCHNVLGSYRSKKPIEKGLNTTQTNSKEKVNRGSSIPKQLQGLSYS